MSENNAVKLPEVMVFAGPNGSKTNSKVSESLRYSTYIR